MKKQLKRNIIEETLDNSNLEKMRELGKKMVDDMVDHLQNINNTPAWQKIPNEVKNSFKTSLPEEGQNLSAIYNEFTQNILPYPTGNIHPRFFSWVQGSGTLTGAFADFLASSMNPNCAIGEQSALYLEQQVLDWSKKIIGYNKNAGGILLSGGSIANITALIIARNNFSEAQNIRKNGLQSLDKKLVFYCSSETHSCLQKAAETIGLGSDAVIKIPVNEDYQIRIDILRQQIKQDLAQGLAPFCIVGNAGTVNTGNIDDIETLSAIAKEYNLWLHIDGAYGALAVIAPECKAKLEAINKADSVAFDFHKWFHMNYEVGCLLVKDGGKHRASFAMTPNYLSAHDRGLPSGPDSFNNWGMELSRGFKALKIWMNLKEHGLNKYQRLISQNIAQAKYLAELIAQEDELELVSTGELSIICYRFIGNRTDEQELNNLNKELLFRLHEEGIATPSYTILSNQYVIRSCITNHRTKRSDLELLVNKSVEFGQDIINKINN